MFGSPPQKMPGGNSANYGYLRNFADESGSDVYGENGKMKRQVLLVPSGGLGNRMRVLACAVTMMETLPGRLDVVWFRHSGLNAAFSDLFEPVDGERLRLREGSLLDALLLERPRRNNLWVPRMFQRLLFRARLYEQYVTPLFRQGFDFRAWASRGNVYMATYTRFFPYEPATLRRLFVPVPRLRERIDGCCVAFTAHTVGVHVRRTDHADAIAESPLELFFEKLDAEMARRSDTRIYLATDSEDVKEEMKARYGQRLMCSGKQADRTSLAGIEDGVVEMFVLARTQKIYGSYLSSFSEIASELGGVPLEVVRRS